MFQQLKKVNLKLQEKGRTIFDFIDTLSAFAENLTSGSEKLKQELS